MSHIVSLIIELDKTFLKQFEKLFYIPACLLI